MPSVGFIRNFSSELDLLAPPSKRLRKIVGHGTETAGHVPEIVGHDAEITGHDLPKYAPIT